MPTSTTYQRGAELLKVKHLILVLLSQLLPQDDGLLPHLGEKHTGEMIIQTGWKLGGGSECGSKNFNMLNMLNRNISAQVVM